MSASLEAGLFSVVGVIIGGLLTAVVTEFRDRSRAAREQRRASILAANDLRQAADAVRETQTNLRQPAGEWPPGWDYVAWTRSWFSYREELADGLKPTAFQAVADAFASLVQLEKALTAGKRPFIDSDEEFITRVDTRITAAQTTLSGP
jgi:type II secretory pathway pseudopilin PulG